ncbi:MAG: HAD family hydrolase [Armatimonadota bacterium]
MRYDAIIFDLFGTLVDNITIAQYLECLGRTADALGLDRQVFIDHWTSEGFRGQRRTGVYHSTAEQLAAACAHLGTPVDPERIAAGVQMQYTYFGLPSLAPRDGVLDTLTHLKATGCALGLVSDCSWEVPELWEQTEFAGVFDTTIFSCAAGARKPDQMLFRAVCAGLAVTPERCLYIGDGDGRELTGARQAGMDAMLICMPHEREEIMQREDPRQWDGPVIEGILEVLGYLGLAEETQHVP